MSDNPGEEGGYGFIPPSAQSDRYDYMTDIDAVIDDLHSLRMDFGDIGDDYRQGRIDAAIEQLEGCKEAKEQYKEVGKWPGSGE